jgi:glutathione S-transferase
VLTENVAILTYLARSFPHAKLLPEEPIGMARCLSRMAYLSNTVHPAFKDRMLQRPAVRRVLEREQSPLLRGYQP